MVIAVVPRDAATFDPAGLYEPLTSGLPRAFLPSYVVVCDDLPRTTTNKVRKAGLAERLDLTAAWRPPAPAVRRVK